MTTDTTDVWLGPSGIYGSISAIIFFSTSLDSLPHWITSNLSTAARLTCSLVYPQLLAKIHTLSIGVNIC